MTDHRPGAEPRIPRSMMEGAASPDGLSLAIAEGLVMKPGDSLVVVLKENLPMDQMVMIDQQLKESLPDVNVVIMGGADISVIRVPADMEEGDGGE